MESVLGKNDKVVEQSLNEWRSKAVENFLITNAIVYLPGIILLLYMHLFSITEQIKLLVLIPYIILIFTTILRQIDYKIRLWIIMGFTYAAASIMSIMYNNAPFMRAMPTFLPIILLVLIGKRTAFIATIISIIILIFNPLICTIPVINNVLGADPGYKHIEWSLILTQGLGLSSVLIALMILLSHFHIFLMQSLVAVSRATTDLEKQTEQLTAAHAEIENEMNERRHLEHEIARLSDEERRHFGQDVHDGVCQQLTGALLRCRALERKVERKQNLVYDELNALSTLLEEAINEAYSISKGLYPLNPDPGALVPALQTLTERINRITSVQCSFIAANDIIVSDPVTAHHLYRIAQEALSNASRHAQASKIILGLHHSDGDLMLSIEDNGTGLPAEIPSSGMGLQIMAYRARIIDGEITVGQGINGGTCVKCRVPKINHSITVNPICGKSRENQN